MMPVIAVFSARRFCSAGDLDMRVFQMPIQASHHCFCAPRIDRTSLPGPALVRLPTIQLPLM